MSARLEVTSLRQRARAAFAAHPYALLVLGLSLVVGALARLYVAFTDDGIFWPDEVYQSLEPAHRLVFGYGMVAWEFIDGARNWALPGLVAALMKLAQLLGLATPRGYLSVVRLGFVALSVGAAWATYRLATSQGASELMGAVAAAAFACSAVPIYFGHRAMSETACSLPVVWGLALVLQNDASRRQLMLGGSLLGVGVLLRLQCGVFAAGALAVLLARRQWRPAQVTLATLGVWALIFGALDHFTWANAPGAVWGGWFHSAKKYIEFNLIEGKAAGWGTAPWSFYVEHLWAAMPALTLLTVAGLVVAARRALGVLLIGLAFFALHCAVPHKEIRFVLPVLPVFFAVAAVGASSLKDAWQASLAAPAGLVVTLLSLLHAPALTFGELGQYPERPQAKAWDDYGPVNRLLIAASKLPDVCGVRIDAAHLAWAGGHSYLHQKVPLYHLGQPPPQSRLFNYVITGKGSGAQVVASDGPLELVHLAVEPCAVDTGYQWRLP